MIEQDDVGKAFQISQALGEFRRDFDEGLNARSPCGLDRHIFNLFEWAVNDANRPIVHLHDKCARGLPDASGREMALLYLPTFRGSLQNNSNKEG